MTHSSESATEDDLSTRQTIEITVMGTPPKKNDRHRWTVRQGRPTHYPGKYYKDFLARLTVAWSNRPGQSPAASGLWHCSIESYWARRSLAIGHGTPRVDVDAPISPVFDAMQSVGIIDDDMRITSVSATKYYDKANPRVVIRLYPVIKYES